MRKISITCPVNSLDDYKRLAEKAIALGATHLSVSQIEPSLWMWDADRNDPYPNWSIERPSVFKFIVPEELKMYLPADYAQRNLERLVARAEILKEYGLRGTFDGMEPAYLPEQAYLDHPHWRGPRCDQARRARKEYYAPCIDDGEMYAIYVRTIKDLCKAAPFESFNLLTNDSGSGLCWASGLYPGKNGPSRCEDGFIGTRIIRFLDMFQKGAALAGLKAEVNVWHIAEEDAVTAYPLLKDGQSVNNHTNSARFGKEVIGFNARRADTANPVTLMPRLVNYAEGLQNAQEHPQSHIEIGIRDINDKESFDFVTKYFGKVKPGPLGRYQILNDFARDLVGEDLAPKLSEMWEQIEKAIHRFEPYNTGGHIFCLGTVHQRWLTRPLVAFPGELRPEEKDYFRPFQFQAQGEENADDLMDLQANRWLGSYSADILYTMSMSKALPEIATAVRLCAEVIKALPSDHPYAARLCSIERRVKMYRCIVRNAANVIGFQSILDRTDYNEIPADTSPVTREQGDIRLDKLNRIVRAEIDNTQEMLDLMDAEGDPMLYCSESEASESIMIYGPEIANDLRRKISIMQAHRRDFLRLYRSYNR